MDVDTVMLLEIRAEAVQEGRGKKATVAVHAGITYKELQSVISIALDLPSNLKCYGFLLAASNSNKQTTQLKRIVPLSLVCSSPHVLRKHHVVDVLLRQDTFRDGKNQFLVNEQQYNSSVNKMRQSSESRVKKFIEALVLDKVLSYFEAAVLEEWCEANEESILQVMRSDIIDISQKRNYLLNSFFQSNLNENMEAHTKTSRSRKVVERVDGNEVFKKVNGIARIVFSPEIQSELFQQASQWKKTSFLAKEATVKQFVELLTTVERLLNKHALSEEHGLYLVKLILTENRVVFNALDAYKEDMQLVIFENTLKRIASMGCPHSPQSPEPPEEKKHHLHDDDDHHHHEKKSKQKERKGFIVRPHDILHTLYQKRMITDLQFDLLRALVNQNDPQVQAAVNAYEENKKLSLLCDQLVAIVAEIVNELEEKDFLQKKKKKTMTKFTKSKSKKKKTLETLPPLLSSTISKKRIQQQNMWNHLGDLIQYWFERELLTEDQVYVLQQLIARRHDLLMSAYEVFQTDKDQSELFDTIDRIAKLQLQSRDESELNAFSQIVELHCHALQSHEKKLVKQLFARKNELVHAAWEVFELEQNTDDFADTLLRIARFSSRKDSKLRLVQVVGEMLRRNLIRSHEADGLIRLFEEKNEAMIAANEAFESDDDVKELVETLLLIVKHANFGGGSSPYQSICGTDGVKKLFVQALDGKTTNIPNFSSLNSPYTPGTESFFAYRLIEILGEKKRLLGWQQDLLLSLLSRNDARLLAAVDVYMAERNASDLVDTLWRLCDLAAWEQNQVAIVEQWVEPLELEGKISRGVLRSLIKARDDRVVAAFVVYMGDGNGEEFQDTLVHISRIAQKQSLKKKIPQMKTPDSSSNLSLAAKRNILKELEFSKYLTSDESGLLEKLAEQGDDRILAIFDLLATTGDINDCMDSFQKVLKMYERNSNNDLVAQMEKQLLHFVYELDLNSEQSDALKYAISRNDPMIKAALEVYAAEKNEDDLKDTLRRVAHYEEKGSTAL